MAKLSYGDLTKRNNISVITNRVTNLGSFREETESGELLVCTGIIRTNISNKKRTLTPTEDYISAFLGNRKTSDKLEIEVMRQRRKTFVPITKLFKDDEFGGRAGKSSGAGSERQESGVIQIINETVIKSNNFYISSIGRNKKILKAEKNTGLSPARQEPYIDVFIYTHDGEKLGVSMKGKSAPSLAGGGLVGVRLIAPDLLDDLYEAIEKYMKSKNLAEGLVINNEVIPDLFYKITDKYIRKLLVGNKKMGGPIDYMYVGDMNPRANVSYSRNEINFVNGKFYTIDEYMKKVPEFFFRIRKRDLDANGDIKITYSKKNREGYPILFMSPKTSKNNFRLVITDKVPSTGQIIK